MKFANSILITTVLMFGIVLANCAQEEAPEAEPEATEEVAMSEEAERGQQLYSEAGCEGCHGVEGRGDGPAGQALNPRPREFQDTTAYQKGSSQEEITAMLEEGIEGTAMVGYSHLSEEDRSAIAAFIVYLQDK